jgi:hypothetical protein
MTFRTNRRTKRKFWSSAARKYVDAKTNYLIEEEDKSPAQAYAIAVSIARRKGYKIPQKHSVAHPKKRRRSSYVPFASVAESISKRAG